MKIISKNKKATFNFEIVKIFEAGISLKGYEVKSATLGNIDINGSYVIFDKNGNLILKNSKFIISDNLKIDFNSNRDKQLLLHKKELKKISLEIREKKFSIIPIKMYFKNGKVKLEIGLGKGLKKYDRRQKSKEKEFKKDLKEIDKYKKTL